MTDHPAEPNARDPKQTGAADGGLNIAGPPPLPTKTIVLVILVPTLLVAVLLASGGYAISRVAYRYHETRTREADRAAAEHAALEQARREQAAAMAARAEAAAARAKAEIAERERAALESQRARQLADREREQENSRQRLVEQQLKLQVERSQQSMRLIQQKLLSGVQDQGSDGRFLPSVDRGSMLSWRVHLLPLLGLDSLYREFRLNESWDSEHNLSLVSRMPTIFGDDPEGRTRVRTLLRLDGELETQTQIGDLLDGAEQTALLFHVPQRSAVVWTKPDRGARFADYFPAGFHPTAFDPWMFTLCSSTKLWIEPEMPLEVAQAIATSAGGELLDEVFLEGKGWLRPDQQFRLHELTGDEAPGIRRISERDEAAEAGEKLSKITTALATWQQAIDTGRTTASNGTSLSWRVHLLPHLGQEELHQKFRFDEPWNSKHNLALAKVVPEVFRLGTTHGRTRVVLALRSREPMVLDQSLPKAGAIVDDPSLTVALLLAAPQCSEIWTKPGKQYPLTRPLQQTLGWPESSSVLAATMSGDLITIPPKLHPSKVAAIFSMQRKERFDLQAALKDPTQSLRLIPEVRPADPIAGIIKLPPLSVSYSDLKPRDVNTNADLELARKLTFAVGAFNQAFDRPPTQVVLPDGTRSGLSWRVHLLPFLDEKLLYEQFNLDEPWDSEHNRKLLAAVPSVFRTASSEETKSNLRVLSGKGTLLAAQKQWMRAQDGLANTIMFLMVGQDLEQEWTKPDTDIELVSDELQQICLNAEGVRAILGTGDVLTFSRSTPGPVVRSLATADGGELIDAGTVRRWLAFQRGEHWLMRSQEIPWEMSQMTTIVSAMHFFESVHRRYPPQAAGNKTGSIPLIATQLSWRVHLLPFLGYETLYRQFRLEEPWDSPHNQQLLPLMPDCYRDAKDPPDSWSTRILTFSGPGTAFPELGLAPSAHEITDGTAMTICFVQAPAELAVPWTQPLDLVVDLTQERPHPVLEEMARVPGLKVALFDGSIRRLATTIDPATLKAMITPAGKEFLKSAELFQPH